MAIESLVIVTGLSGAGKTSVLNFLEDMDYLTMDNLPCTLSKFIIEKYSVNHKELRIKKGKINKIAIGLDIRSFEEISEYLEFLDFVKEMIPNNEIIFLEASDEMILNRYNLTRRKHPLEFSTLLENIKNERDIMYGIRERATKIIDTSYLSAKQLGEKIKENYYLKNKDLNELNIHLQSFGFKYGMPIDLDLVFDVRFLPNPYYIKELKIKNGKDKDVQDYVMDSEVSKEFYNRLMDMIKFLIPNYIKEGKKHLSIGFGCSGGKHRSVTFVQLFNEELSKIKNIKIYTSNREEEKGHW
ncbi:MAG: RNase adapter RapZ [Fusobacteriaceae bacterium]